MGKIEQRYNVASRKKFYLNLRNRFLTEFLPFEVNPVESKGIKTLSLLIASYLLDRIREGKFIPRLFTCISFYPMSIFTSISLYLCQSRLMPISFYLLLFQIRAYLFQSRFLYLWLFFVYPPLFLYTSLYI